MTGSSTFTTQVKVTIGADKMYAGTKEIALDVPAYIANGYTMLPVRAVTEALSGAAIVNGMTHLEQLQSLWSEVINMTVGSKTMVINGVNVAMQAACEITTAEHSFLLETLDTLLVLTTARSLGMTLQRQLHLTNLKLDKSKSYNSKIKGTPSGVPFLFFFSVQYFLSSDGCPPVTVFCHS